MLNAGCRDESNSQAPFFRLVSKIANFKVSQRKNSASRVASLIRRIVFDLNLQCSKGQGQTAKHRLPLIFWLHLLHQGKRWKKTLQSAYSQPDGIGLYIWCNT